MEYPKAFSKGLFSSPGDNIMPYPYSTDMRNIRIDNNVMSVRKGYRNVVRDNSFVGVSGMASNNGNVYAVVNGSVKSVDLTAGSFTNIWSLGNTNRVYPLVFNKFTIFLSDGVPYVYDGTTLSQVTTVANGSVNKATFAGTGLNDLTSGGTNNDTLWHTFQVVIDGTGAPNTFKWRVDAWSFTTGVNISGSAQTLSFWTTITFASTTGHTLNDTWTIISNPRDTPRFWVSFLGTTWVAGGGSGNGSKRNILFVSVPIANSPENSYNFTGSGSAQLVRKSDILALCSTLGRMFIFEEDRIEWIDKSSFTTISGVVNFFSNPFAQWEAVVSNGAVIVAGDKVLFLTKGKRIKTINYVLGVDQVELGDLSNSVDVGITKFLDEQLNDDLSQTVWYYDEIDKHCKWFVRSRNSVVNDLCLIFDLVNGTFLVDDNKYVNAITKHDDGNTYSGGSLNTDIYQDESGQDDDGAEISWYRFTAPLDSEKPYQNKMFYEVATTGTIDSTTIIKKEIFVDDNSVDTSFISKPSPISGQGVWSNPVGVVEIGENPAPEQITRFTKRRWPEYINSIWKFLQIKYSGSWVGQNFTLETIHTREKTTEYREYDDV